jgi:molybdopterin/thiamine biosynthesis adenylyltransferase
MRTFEVTLRLSESVKQQLLDLAFSRYPKKEWGSFFLFGFRKSDTGLVVTVSELLPPTKGDLESSVAIVRFKEPYIVRAAMAGRAGSLCIGVFHSHPEDYGVRPSPTDDDMDEYYADYFSGFTNEPCYFSLIVAKDGDGNLEISGRGWFDGKPCQLLKCLVSGPVVLRQYGISSSVRDDGYRERLSSLLGADSAARLKTSTVAIIGCSGTGSPAAHVLARAGVGNFILIDPQRMDKSNVERVHGSYPTQFSRGVPPYKVESLRELIIRVNPDAKVIAIVGNILQGLARDYATRADLILGCTDSHHGRVALAELSYRYLTPSIDVGVKLEGEDGKVTAEVGQIALYAPGSPCAYCLSQVDGRRVTYELMSEDERNERRRLAADARARGDEEGGYWKDYPELHTVGHLATLGGALSASYAIGWLTGKFTAPDQFFQFDILAQGFGYVPLRMDPKVGCVCSKAAGFADQGAAYSVISAPSHWPDAFLL